MINFSKNELKSLWSPELQSGKGQNGQATIIGGSSLFHGAPLLAIQAASRMVDMVFFSSPEPELEKVSAKAVLKSFIWVPWKEIESYVIKSEVVLIGSGMMRYQEENPNSLARSSEMFDEEGTLTRSVTKYFLQKYPNKQWVIDGGSLQVMEKEWIPKQAILTCNSKEFEKLFNVQYSMFDIQELAKKHHCVIVHKNVISHVSDGERVYEITGGNAGLTKGGTGDVQAGLTTGFAAKNPPVLAAAAAAYVIKIVADKLFEKVGFNYNADDVAKMVFEAIYDLTKR